MRAAGPMNIAQAQRAVEKARDQVAAVVGALRGEVIFTSGATESDNLAILGLAEHGVAAGKKHIASTVIEHNAVLEPVGALSRDGFDLTLIPPTAGGWVDPQIVRAALRPDTLLVSVMHVNNETGIIQPIREIANVLAGHEAYFHVDAAQGFGKELESLREPRIDLISISGHKINAPKGVGALITRKRNGQRPPLKPLMHGGGQELGLRPGTLPVHLIVGLGLAAELAMLEHRRRQDKCRLFRHRLLEAIAPLSPLFIGEQDRGIPNIINVSFPGIDAETAMDALRGIVAISHGAACALATMVCSRVVCAMGLSEERATEALRLSWCHLTKEPDWAAFTAAIAGIRANRR